MQVMKAANTKTGSNKFHGTKTMVVMQVLIFPFAIVVHKLSYIPKFKIL